MNSRIYAGLKASAAADPHVRLQAERFDRARISTLDAFCSQVLKLSSSRFGLPPTFTLDDEKAGDLARRLTFSFILENAEDPSMGFLITANGFTRVLDGFGGLATRYLHLGETRDFPELHRRQFGFLAEEIERLAARYAELRREILALDPGPGITETQAANLEKARGILKSAGPELPAEPGRLLGIAGDLKTFPLPGKTTKLELLRYRDLANALRDLAAEIKPLAGTLESKDLLAGLFDLLGRFQEAVQRERLVSGIISFQDCAELAVRALAEDESLRAYYKGLFRYIMIDEFQDNNRLQKNLLYLLAEKRDRSAPGIPLPEDLEAGKLFFVGDEKQSIYRFRGADVAVFKGLSEELEGGGAFVDLEVNYRSEPGLIDFFNHLFSRLLGGAEKNFEARFVPLKAREPRLRAKPQIAVYRHPYVKDDEAEEGEEKLGADEAEAFFLASKIKAWVEGRSLAVPAEAGDRPADYGDVAVLMRSTSNQTVYERMFRLLDVPYETRSTRSLFLEAPANDLYAFLQCLVYPEDGEAYAALLRSPFVNVSDEALVAILLEERLAFRLQEEAAERLDEADRGRYLAAAELYREAEDLARHASVPELLSFLWFEGGYRFSVLRNPAKHAYLELYDYLREYALMAEGESLASFLDRLRPNLGKYERIPELGIQRGKSSGVRILTVHEAKGLEFPVVILANAGNQGRNDSGGSELFHVSREHGLSVGLGERGGKYNYFYVLGKKDEEEEAAAELKRLLYVACTRAEAHLVVSGCFNRNNREGEKSFLGLVFAALGLSPDDEAGEPVFPCGSRPDPGRDAGGDRGPFPGAEGAAARGGPLPLPGRALRAEGRKDPLDRHGTRGPRGSGGGSSGRETARSRGRRSPQRQGGGYLLRHPLPPAHREQPQGKEGKGSAPGTVPGSGTLRQASRRGREAQPEVLRFGLRRGNPKSGQRRNRGRGLRVGLFGQGGPREHRPRGSGEGPGHGNRLQDRPAEGRGLPRPPARLLSEGRRGPVRTSRRNLSLLPPERRSPPQKSPAAGGTGYQEATSFRMKPWWTRPKPSRAGPAFPVQRRPIPR